jgi:hypothetical protein
MQRSFCSLIIASLLIVLLAMPQPADAWGNTGHEAVACIAWQQLDQPTKDKVFALLKLVPTRTHTSAKGVTESIPGFAEWSQDMPSGLSEDQQHMYIFMRAATWPDSIKHKFLQDSDNAPANKAVSESNIGFTDTQSHGYWHFVDTPLPKKLVTGSSAPEVPKSCWDRTKKPPAPPDPVTAIPSAPEANAATEISLLSADLASGETDLLKAYDMIWLEHLVGDIHQPLHAIVRFVGGIGDEGGNCVIIDIPSDLRDHFTSSSKNSKPPAELHAFWDDLPGIGGQMDTPQAVAYASTLDAADATQAGISDPTVWSKESYEMAIKDAYTDPIGPSLGSPTAYAITDAYFKQANADAKARIALAGARLAKLLTNALK